jgi:hypothetical protein
MGASGRCRPGHCCRGRRAPEVSPRHPLAVDHHPPPRTLATCGLPAAGSPLFAGATLPSAHVSAQSRWPGASRGARDTRPAFRHTPWAPPSRRRRQPGLEDGERAGKTCRRAPLRRRHRMPSQAGRVGRGFGPPRGEALSAGSKGAIFAPCASVSAGCARATGRTPFAVYDSGRVPPRQPQWPGAGEG